MSKIEVDAIDKQSGSTLTLGGSGTAVTLASGATQSGFGRTGTVDWQTTKKTLAFTAVNGEGYFVDTAASGAVTMTLPSSPSAGNIVAVKDYNGNFATANLTIARNGSAINGGSTADVVINTNGASIVLVYVDATQGWVATQDDSSTFVGEDFMSATGGTITTCGNCKIHTFTSPGTFTVCSISSSPANNQVSYVVVAGGGAGSSGAGGGGGGAGGFREDKSPVTPYTASPLDGAGPITVTATAFPITVGAGGTASPSTGGPGGSGSNSVFSTITSAGGGGTGAFKGVGVAGGSGGGGTSRDNIAGGAGNTPPVSPPQGNSGGGANAPNSAGTNDAGGGGGGATAAGREGNNTCDPQGGPGGAGATTVITGTPTIYAGGGGGGRCNSAASGLGGPGGGGKGGSTNNSSVAGTANTGGGGGGAREECQPNGGSNGGSGIVIIRYKYQ